MSMYCVKFVPSFKRIMWKKLVNWSVEGIGGVLQFGFGGDMPPRNLKVDKYKY